MKKTFLFITLGLLTTSFAHAYYSSTECTFKTNPRNKIYLDFNFNGNQLDRAKALLLIQTGSKVSDFTYYNYAFMTNAMTYREYIPYGRRAEFVSFVEKNLSFKIVNYGATNSSVEFQTIPGSKKEMGLVNNAKQSSFRATLKTILKTEGITALENGTSLSVNEVSCIHREF